jgi:6-phosphogluconate dehydrogenase
MAGGSAEAYAALGPLLESISAKVDGIPCCVHAGPDGAGHFVKMIHNGIEYADMQLISEAYCLLRQALGLSPAEIADVFRGWNSGELRSYLVEITAEVLAHTDPATGGALVDVIVDRAELPGSGRWTGQSALDLGVPATVIVEALTSHALARRPDQRASAAKALRGPDLRAGDRSLIEDVRVALLASKVVAYAQGFDHIAAASKEYGWGTDKSATAAAWRGGCIIRSPFIEKVGAAYEEEPNLPSLLVSPLFSNMVNDAQDAWRRVAATAVTIGVPVPGFTSALAYYDGLRRERLPAALIQGLRDYFAAGAYRRVDREGLFHTDWSGDKGEYAV